MQIEVALSDRRRSVDEDEPTRYGDSMTPHEFVTRWKNTSLKERSAAQPHFIDLCALLDERPPTDVDQAGQDYAFEVGANKSTGGLGFADVFKRGHFAWEYKGSHADLDKAYAQLQKYAVALSNPPLLIVSDIGTTIRIHTNWTNSVSRTYVIPIEEIGDPEKRGWLKAAFSDPEALRPKKTRKQLTEEVAGEFALLARLLLERHQPQENEVVSSNTEPANPRERARVAESVAHFINRLVFCMFAEDVKLLANDMFVRMLDRAIEDPTEFERFAKKLFRAMRSGGTVGFEKVTWFNGGLFDDDKTFPLTVDEIRIVRKAATQYWGDIDPSILGTLFERGLDPNKRSELGAHYTSAERIASIIDPVIVMPLLAEWRAVKARVEAAYKGAAAARSRVPMSQREARKVYQTARRAEEAARRTAVALFEGFLVRMRDFRVLDPACGSGNFLYSALKALKDIEHLAIVEMEAMSSSYGFPYATPLPSIGPENVLGIEKSPYAAELARVSVWIGEIQWMLRNGYPVAQNPVLKPLDTIALGDALIRRDEGNLAALENGAEDGEAAWVETEWPEANVLIGNPPFLTDRKMRNELSDDYVDALRSVYRDRVPGRADLVVYWLQKAAEKLVGGAVESLGFVATKSVAKGASRTPLDLLAANGRNLITSAVTNELWEIGDAQVRVAIVCASTAVVQATTGNLRTLNGAPVDTINPDLTSGVDVTRARRLASNRGVAFQGVKLTGPFDIPGLEARAMLKAPSNPNGRLNADVVKRLYDIDDIVGRDSDRWVIDFGTKLDAGAAALYEAPFGIVEDRVVPFREDPEKCRSDEMRLRTRYWEFQRPRPELRKAMGDRKRLILTPESSEHRLFIFAPTTVLPQGSLFAIVRDDETTFGILSSRIHEVWSTAQGNRLGVGNQRRYNATVVFATFPFPDGLTPDLPVEAYASDPRSVSISAAVRDLLTRRDAWLNPPELVRREAEIVSGYPVRIIPVDEAAAEQLRRRTLTDLYNLRPKWLLDCHAKVDAAVETAYGWAAGLTDEEILAALMDVNGLRSSANVEGDPIEEDA